MSSLGRQSLGARSSRSEHSDRRTHIRTAVQRGHTQSREDAHQNSSPERTHTEQRGCTSEQQSRERGHTHRQQSREDTHTHQHSSPEREDTHTQLQAPMAVCVTLTHLLECNAYILGTARFIKTWNSGVRKES